MTAAPSVWTIAGPVIAAIIAGLVALAVLSVNLYQTRRDARRKDFAEALAAVERYAELPYRVLRRQGTTPEEARAGIVESIHEVQQDLLFHKSWVRIQAPEVADAFDSLLRTTKEEAGSAISNAWRTPPISKDEDMPLGSRLHFPRMDEERMKYIEAVRRELKFSPRRWIKNNFSP